MKIKDMANLNKKHILVFRSSYGVPWFLSRPMGSNDYSFFGSSLVFYTEQIYEVQRIEIVRKSIFEEL